MNKTSAVIFGALTWAILLLIVINQLRLHHLIENTRSNSQTGASVDAETIRRTTAALEGAQREAALVSQRAADVARQLQALEARLQQLQSRQTAMPSPPNLPVVSDVEVVNTPAAVSRGRGWSPEQVVGPPDTMQAGMFRRLGLRECPMADRNG